MSNYTVDGHVEAGYERVQSQFEQFLKDGVEENMQLCVYVGGQIVVDLCGRQASHTNFTADSLVNVFRYTLYFLKESYVSSNRFSLNF